MSNLNVSLTGSVAPQGGEGFERVVKERPDPLAMYPAG